MNVVLRKNVLDGLDASVDRICIGSGTVLPEKIFQDIRRNDRVPLHRLNKILTNNESGKMLVYFVI